MPEIFPAVAAASSEIVESLLAALHKAGARGATASELRLEKGRGQSAKESAGPALPPRRTALASLIAEGRVIAPTNERGRRYILKEAVPTIERVGAKLLALTSGAPEKSPALWRKSELSRAFSADERPLLSATLAWIEERRGLLRVADGSRDGRFLFTEPLRRWLELGKAAPPKTPAPDPDSAPDPDTSTGNFSDLLAAYARAVRESGGFPDVKISALQRALPSSAASSLPERLRALWREGQVTLSLGDWSLASEEMRKAAVELDGEHYLLVRFEEDPAAEEFSA